MLWRSNTQVCKSFFYYIRKISVIRRFLIDFAAECVIHSFITSKLDYCKSLYHGLPKHFLKRLQFLRNSAARLLTYTKKFEHVTLILIKLYWLPGRYGIIFKILLLVYKCLHNMAPAYLSHSIELGKSSRSVRSTSTFMKYLQEQRSRLVAFERAFSRL